MSHEHNTIYIVSDDDTEAEEASYDNIVPITQSRLDEIKRDTGAFKSTWRCLREQYPPGTSDFAPLSFAASTWGTILSTDTHDLCKDLELDEALSQAATMAAYGLELHRTALVGPNDHMRLNVQLSSILATLCATITDMRDCRRATITKAVAEMVEVSNHAQAADVGVQAAGESLVKTANRWRHSNAQDEIEICEIPATSSTQRYHPYNRCHLSVTASLQQQQAQSP
ncbi:hypothetical protein IWW38_004096, partial [Coemansia aciculifera]